MYLRRSEAGSLALLALVMALGGCGYHFGASGSNLPSGAETIYVARFTNHTRQTGINDVFMRYLDDEIAMHRRLRLVDSPAEADLELSGEILAITPLPSSFNSVLEPTIYSRSMTVAAQLKDSGAARLGYFTSRNIVPIGLGVDGPPNVEKEYLPASRTEIILFVPQ